MKNIGKQLLILVQDIQKRMDNLEEIFRSSSFLDPVLDRLLVVIKSVYDIDFDNFGSGDEALDILYDCAYKRISIIETDKRLKEISKQQNEKD